MAPAINFLFRQGYSFRHMLSSKRLLVATNITPSPESVNSDYWSLLTDIELLRIKYNICRSGKHENRDSRIPHRPGQRSTRGSIDDSHARWPAADHRGVVRL